MGRLLVPLLLVGLMVASSRAAGRTPSCQPLTISMCQGLGYNSTSFPNLLRHRTQDEAALEVNQFQPLVQVACSAVLSQFLCSVYAPMCTPVGVLKPCRSLCKSVRRGCERVLKQFGFQWPTALQCRKFPKKSKDPMCIGKRQIETKHGSTVSPATTGDVAFDRTSVSGTAKPTTVKPTFKVSTTSKPPVCEPLTIPMCQALGTYSQAYFPNSLHHRTQREAALEIQQFAPLVKINCSSYLPDFLCSLYAPVCRPALGVAVPPCRSLCQTARAECAPIMKRFGFGWPQYLDCKRFPVLGSDICQSGRSPPFSTLLPMTTSTISETTISPTTGISCGHRMTSPRGRIISPNYPRPYPNNYKCSWKIHLPSDYHVITFEVKHLFLEEDSKCYYDYVMFLDELHNQVGPRYCGVHQRSFKVDVKGHVAIVMFHSDEGNRKKGFNITYKARRV